MKFTPVSVLAISLALLGAACSSKTSAPILDRVQSQVAAGQTNVQVVAAYPDAQTAKDAAESLKSKGAQVENIDSAGKIQKITTTTAVLAGVNVPNATLITVNTALKIQPQSAPLLSGVVADPLTGQTADEQAQALLVARNVVGVEKLLTRFPKADGRGVKVAVFDTGIDFGVEGLQKFSTGEQKLLGFFDLTGFGKTSPGALTNDAPQKSYPIGSKFLAFDPSIHPQKVQSVGLLDEKKLADAYLAGTGVDLDTNGKLDDTFAYAVGLNAEGKLAVWIDANNDGVINSRDDEELTDYNSTYKYISMRHDLAPSGTRSLAVTITSSTELQFHSIQNGHGTGCSLIIGGDGYANGKLKGMAPKVGFLAYVLDATGQDVYYVDQFLKMFEHAKSQGVDAISISWGFSTADLASARFISDYLDREIASHGILIGIAAGNDGPGLVSGGADDYIPHHGFAVGAEISKDQAENVYGWTGVPGDSVVWYSSVGPSRGGRQVPDVASPLMTWVRDAKGVKPGAQYYAFSGTSSATPALIGASSALVSQLKQEGEVIDARLFKLAIQNSAKRLDTVETLRQGAGLIQVDAAYDIYKRLAAEQKAAAADAKKATPFAYELRAQTPLAGFSNSGEGVHLYGYQGGTTVSLVFTPDTLQYLDALNTIETFQVTHEKAFFETAKVVNVQAVGGKIALKFDAAALALPGVYTDLIRVSRASDGLTLLTVPVVVEIANEKSSNNVLFNVADTLAPFDVTRQTVKLESKSAITFDGIVQEVDEGQASILGVAIRGRDGIKVLETLVPVNHPVQPLTLRTEELLAGEYEIYFYRHFGKQAVLNTVKVSGAFRVPFVALQAAKTSAGDPAATPPLAAKATLALLAEDDLKLSKAVLTLTGTSTTTALTRSDTLLPGTTGYFGAIDLGSPKDTFSIGLRQSALDRALEPFLHLEVSIVSEAGDALYRGWVNVQDAGLPLTEITLLAKAQKVRIIAYPNIVDWTTVQTQGLTFEASIPFEAPLIGTAELVPVKPLARNQAFQLDELFPGLTAVPVGSYGTLELFDDTAASVDKLPVRLGF